jgi:hypothetical protein
MDFLLVRSLNSANALLKLNPWARAQESSSIAAAKQLVRARRLATELRVTQGHQVWNRWALAMLALRSRIEHDPASLQAWHEIAIADFAGQIFRERCVFAEFVFPGAVDFSGARFTVDAWYNAARFTDAADFSGAVFD